MTNQQRRKMSDGQVTQDGVRVLYQAGTSHSIKSMNSKLWPADPRRLELQTTGVYEW